MSAELRPGVVATIADGVRRLVAPNPSMMTGPGTNTYLVGKREIAVIDPGPVIDSHLERLAGIDGIRWIIATHTHPDHSPGARVLAEKTGAELIGLPAPGGPQQDRTFRPARIPADGETLVADSFTLRFLHTPGHASNHVCLLHEAHRWLFTGDHIMGGSTVVIDPPDGNMKDYLLSLRALRERDLAAIAPGHGDVLDDPHAVIDDLVAHRLGRESKVRDALHEHPGLDTAGLVVEVYREVDPRLHRLAQRSLLAHLIKLQDDGEATLRADAWWPVEA